MSICVLRLGPVLLWASLSLGVALAGQPGTEGTFRFLTQDLPNGSTNTEYAANLVTANAAGTVTFSSNPSPPAPGLSLSASTGFVSGIPTVVNASGFNVTFSANDGSTTITLTARIRVTASGGGGNSGVSFSTTALPDGRVGTAYSATLESRNAVGPVLYGATDLPPGLSLNGTSGAISGTPSGAGTYYVTFSVTDIGENDNKVFTVLPLLVLPETSAFQFTNILLDNGEVGTAYQEDLATSGGNGGVHFSASGLPPGLSINSGNGRISGTPTSAGTFLVNCSASDNTDTIVLNRTILIAPSATSSFFWNFFGLPAGIVDIEYGRQPPILVAASNGSNSVSYSASGLPGGIAYNSNSGELSGVPLEVGINPVVFTATDSASGEVLVLAMDFVVLPANGGDTNSLPINLWVRKMTLKPGTGQAGAWKALFIYNADRRPANAFDPASHIFSTSLGSRTLTLAAGSMTTSNGRHSYRSAAGATPLESVVIDPRKQGILLSTAKDSISDTVPGVLRHTMSLGNKGYKLDLFFDSSGKFTPTSGYRKTAFVVYAAKVLAKGGGSDALALSLLLGDPSFAFTAGSSALRFRFLDGATVLVDKTFTDLVTARESTDSRTGGTVYALKSGKDSAVSDTLAKFSYLSSTGKMLLAMKNLNLTSMPASPAHMTVELTVGEKIYSTRVTLFAAAAGSYSTLQR